MRAGIAEFSICTGARNSALIDCLEHAAGIETYFFYDERSAAFFALGRARASQRPVGIIVTSGTAVGELLPAVMEAYYSGVPLLVISADRPRSFRGSGAPQAAEQVGIFGLYTPLIIDVQAGENPSLANWTQRCPAQLNVCFEESYSHSFDEFPDLPPLQPLKQVYDAEHSFNRDPLRSFFEQSKHPIAIVGTLPSKDRAAVQKFLKETAMPVYCEGPSGIRESTLLESQKLTSLDSIWKRSKECGTPVDGILRIGGVPTTRLWRDLEIHSKMVNLCSISHLPFAGLSWASVIYTDLTRYFSTYGTHCKVYGTRPLIENDRERYRKVQNLLKRSEGSEPSLLADLSDIIPPRSLLYLGNSLPIREWDLAASYRQKLISVEASRGLNGIDGQISTFLGLADSHKSNWAIVGDLTALYDLSGPWVLRQQRAENISIVVINNGGGMIFSRLFKNERMQNKHGCSLKPMADLWELDYQLCKGRIEFSSQAKKPRLIECIPNAEATERFWKEYARLDG